MPLSNFGISVMLTKRAEMCPLLRHLWKNLYEIGYHFFLKCLNI